MTDSSHRKRLWYGLRPLIWLGQLTRSKGRHRPRCWHDYALSFLLALLVFYENLPAEAEFEIETRRFHPENADQDESHEDAKFTEDLNSALSSEAAESEPFAESTQNDTLAHPALELDLAQPAIALEDSADEIAPSVPELLQPQASAAATDPVLNPVAETPSPAVDAHEPSDNGSDNFPEPEASPAPEPEPAAPEQPEPELRPNSSEPSEPLADSDTNLLDDELGRLRLQSQDIPSDIPVDPELGFLRLQTLRSRRDEELGILRLLEQAQATAKAPAPTVFIGGRVGLFDSDNVFRSPVAVSEQVAQLGMALYAFPKLTDRTNLYAIAEANLVRYNEFSSVDYNELQLQVGLRQRLTRRSYAQLGWRNRHLYQAGWSDELLRANYIDLLLSRRDVLTQRLWLDSYYQAFVSFVEPTSSSRFHQTLTLSLNYGFSRDFRATLLYQLNLDDYTEIERFDTYHQVLGLLNYSITPNSRITLFGGTKFGNSTSSNVDFDDLIYGIGLNVNVPIF